MSAISALPHDLTGWLAHLERLHPTTIELGLARVQEVYQRLQLSFGTAKVVTVGGTNGKGSSVTMLASILRAAGYQVVTYTSPHLLAYNERVGLQDRLATDAELCAGFAAVEAARGATSLTYFEFGTLAALWLFAQQQPDVIVLEVGLGGRLDAVNILDPDVSLLTNVDLDHMDWLGDTRDKIGIEKAGIFRSQRPAVYGERDMPASVGQVADQQGVLLLRQGVQFGWQLDNESSDANWHWRGEDLQGQPVELANLPRNDFPLDNAAAVLQVLYKLPLSLSRAAIEQGLRMAVLAGRFHACRYQGQQVILDVAHNPHAARNLAYNIRTRLAGRRVLLVLGMLADKDSRRVVELLVPVVDQIFAATLGGERGASADILYNHAHALGYGALSKYDSVSAAFAAACAEAQQTKSNQGESNQGESTQDKSIQKATVAGSSSQPQAAKPPVIVVTGSFFTVAAVLELV
jgi:dihydrofolate synthase / folylpolyglutamate synthase